MSTLTTFFLVGAVLAHNPSVAANRIFSTRMEASVFCSGQMCSAGDLASNMPGWMCPQYTATNPATHQQVFCGYDGSWSRQTAAPSDCQFNNAFSCHNPNNNCWNTPSPNCDYWCTCWNHGGRRRTAMRLGSGADETAELDHGVEAGQRRVDVQLGTGGASRDNRCPWWLPQAYDQLTPGALGLSCYNQGLLCKYPSARMNFVCSGNNGVWQLQGPAPTPPPVPQPVCPSYWSIWSGFTSCSRNGYLCRYPSYQVNYVCTNGVWERQGNPPAPTPRPTPPPVNDFSCPSSSSYLNAGDYCTTKNQLCAYPNGEKWHCCSTGVWQRQ